MENIFFCIIYIVLMVCILAIGKRIYKTHRTPLTFYSVVWCVVGAISNLGLLDFYYPSFLVNICITLGTIIFSLTYMAIVKPGTIQVYDKFVFCKDEIINYKYMYFASGLGMLFLIPNALNSVKLIQKYGMATLRANLSNQEFGVSHGALWDNLFAYGISPIFVSISIITSVLIFSDQPKKRVIPLFITSIVTMGLSAISKASRAEFIRFLFCLIVSLLLCRRKTISNLFKNKLLRRGLALAVVSVLVVTFQRANSEKTWLENIQRTIYIYYFSGPSYMTQLLNNVTEYGPHGKLLLGSATFGFLTNFVSFALTIITGKSCGSLYLMGSVLTNVSYKVGNNTAVNAMSTCYYNFLLDWSYAGILIGPMCLAIFASFFTKKVYREKTVQSMSLYVFFLYILFRTCFKLELVSISFSMTCFYIILFANNTFQKDNTIKSIGNYAL